MVNRATRCAALVFVSLCLTIFIACGVSSTPITISPTNAVLLPSQAVQFTAATGDFSSTNEPWQVNGVTGGSAATGTINQAGLYTAPATAPSGPVAISVHGFSGKAAVTFFDPANVTPGSVATTNNPIVAAYSISIPANSSVHVQFGPDTKYGFLTSPVPAPPGGGSATVLVAGMRASSTYHMQAIVNLVNGAHVLDTDQSFTTGDIPANLLPKITTAISGTPALNPGIELFSLDPLTGGTQYNAVATDLGGNVIWYYDLGNGAFPFPIKPLPNGHMIVVVASSGALAGTEIREIDLAGNVINKISTAQVNSSLAGVASFKVASFHHDILVLPNGHYILLADYSKTFNNTPGLPNGTIVAGDALVEWDPIQNAALWTWSTFDHLDPTRIPYGIANGVADWTHGNAVIYSPDDGNIILSLRNQNWILKINYQNGTGDGSILWKLGYQGSFTLPAGQAPKEWNYGQHFPTIVSQNSSGLFSLMFFNNGNARLLDSDNDPCGTIGIGNCYSSVPVLQLNESSMTASVLSEVNLAPAYSICCGDALFLPNGNLEYDVAFDIGTPGFSHIQEVTPGATPQVLLNMDIAGQLAYRGYRIPSLYPGVTWPPETGISPATKARARSAGKPVPFPVDKLP
jgi:arylsulfate sulfotransferase